MINVVKSKVMVRSSELVSNGLKSTLNCQNFDGKTGMQMDKNTPMKKKILH